MRFSSKVSGWGSLSDDRYNIQLLALGISIKVTHPGREGPRVMCVPPSESWKGELTSGFVRFKLCRPPFGG